MYYETSIKFGVRIANHALKQFDDTRQELPSVASDAQWPVDQTPNWHMT